MFRLDCKNLKFIVAIVALASVATKATAAVVNLTPAGGNGSTSATSVLLSDLISDVTNTATVGDKIFSNFAYSKIGDMPNPDQINVLGIKDADGNWGITFHGVFLDLPGNGPSDALIRFAVEVEFLTAQQGVRITDAHLTMGGVGAGDEGFLSVDETFAGHDETLNVFFSTLGPNTPPADAKLTDFQLITPPATKLFVTKDILAIAADNSTQPTRTTAIDQSFSQSEIPEPASLVLLGLTGLSLFGASRRRG